MNYTKKEIELAHDMKEAGLEWKPEAGDWFYERTQDDIYHVCTSWGSAIISFYNDEINEFGMKDCVWLPLWDQCRDILATHNISFMFVSYTGSMICYKELGEHGKGWRQFIGDTDLDMMYQAILMRVLDAPRVADDVEIGKTH